MTNTASTPQYELIVWLTTIFITPNITGICIKAVLSSSIPLKLMKMSIIHIEKKLCMYLFLNNFYIFSGSMFLKNLDFSETTIKLLIKTDKLTQFIFFFQITIPTETYKIYSRVFRFYFYIFFSKNHRYQH